MLDKISVVTTAVNAQVVEDGRALDPFKTMAELRYDEVTLRNCFERVRERLESGEHAKEAGKHTGKPYYFTFDRREFPAKHLSTRLVGLYKAVDDKTTDAVA
jgi:hypothetical protein